MPSIDVDGLDLFYEEKGKGQPLLFVHGIPTATAHRIRRWTPFQKITE